MKTLLILILTLVIFNTCTIEKRVHQRGYFVQWHNSLKKESKTNPLKESEEVEKSAAEVDKTVIEDSTNFQSSARNITNQDSDEAGKTKNSELNTTDLKELDGSISDIVANEEKNQDTPKPIENGEDKTETMALTAFVFSILSFGLLMLTGIPAIIMAGTVLLRIKRNPGKYSKKAKILASIALIISICVVLLSLFFLLYIFSLSF